MRTRVIYAGLVLLSTYGWAQDRHLFDLNIDTGYEALDESKYDRALKFFKDAQVSPVLKEKKEHGLKMYVDELIRLTEKRKALVKINPETTHEVMVLYVKHVSGFYFDDEKQKTDFKEELKDEDVRVAKIHQQVTREMYEAMSDGHFTIHYSDVMLDEPLTTLRFSGGKPWPDWDKYEGAAKTIRENFNTHDTFMWTTNMIHGEAHGGFGRFPIGFGRLSPQKGFIELNPQHSVNIYIHEFFHVVEGMVGIKPSHGHHNKARFPDWPGEVDNSMNYYSWHFSTTIPKKGWDKLKNDGQLTEDVLAAKPDKEMLEANSMEGYEEVGEWAPSQIKSDWSNQEWKLDEQKISSGTLAVMMLYTNGGKAIDIASVSLWNNGKEIAMDEHFGYTGSQNRSNVYKLEVPQTLKGKSVIKARIKGNGGTNSNGKVLMKKL
jgi:hypothetical protein